MIYALISLAVFLWVVYEIDNAPYYDEETGKFYKDKKDKR